MLTRAWTIQHGLGDEKLWLKVDLYGEINFLHLETRLCMQTKLSNNKEVIYNIRL